MTQPAPHRATSAEIAALSFALLFPTAITVAYFVLAAGSSGAVQQAIGGVGKVVQFAFPLVWVVGVCRQRPQFGWNRASGILPGLAFGLAVVAAMLALYFGWLAHSSLLTSATGEIAGKVVGMGFGTPARYVGLAVFYSLVHSFLEEYYWRWFVFGRLRDIVPWPAAVAVSSIGFMLHHVVVLAVYFGPLGLGTWLFSPAVAIGGAVWAVIYHRSGSLWGPWLSHALLDAGIFVIGFFLIRNALLAG